MSITKNKGINVLSLFDGISCARVALDRSNIKVNHYYASEIDWWAQAIAQKNYPDTIQLGDVKNLFTLSLPRYMDDTDLLIGGSPCQDLSIAKKNRKGLDGERSGLFWEYVRILKEVKPKYFILENVNSMPKEAKQLITETLGVEPIMINAALVSAQNRKRLFWTNIPNVKLPDDRGILLKDILEKDVNKSYSVKGVEVIKQGKIITKDLQKSHSLLARDYKGFGNQAMTGIQRISQIDKGGQGDRIYSPEGKSVGLSALGGGRGAKTGLYAIPDKSYCVPSTYYKENVKSLIQRKKKGLMVEENSIIRKLTPVECERLQSLPDNYTDEVSNSQRYKMLGNAFNVEVVAHILKGIAN